MSKQFKNVTFHPECKPPRFKLPEPIVAEEIIEEEEKEWIISWHGVRIRDEETASRIMKNESATRTHIKVNPNCLVWVEKQISIKETRWMRFKKWLLALFRFRQ